LHIARQIGPFCTVQLAVAKALQSRLTAVRAENPVYGSDQHGCSRGHPTVMIIDHVPAVCVRHEALVRREALGIEGGVRPPRRAVAAAWWELSAA
jgi:hypothetical protein